MADIINFPDQRKAYSRKKVNKDLNIFQHLIAIQISAREMRSLFTGLSKIAPEITGDCKELMPFFDNLDAHIEHYIHQNPGGK